MNVDEMSWQQVFSLGFAPLLTRAELESLHAGLVNDDPRIILRQTTDPHPFPTHWNDPVKGADPIAFAKWRGNNLSNVRDVERMWVATALDAGAALGGGFRDASKLFEFFDTATRAEVIAGLLPEVERALAARKELVAA